MAQKMAHFYPQGLLLALLIILSECRVTSPMTEIVSSFQEDDVALCCFNSTVMDPNKCYRVKLMKYATDASQGKVMFAWPRSFQDVKRVKWEADGNGQMSLFLTQLQKSDGGLYGCEICHGWDCTVVKNISLKVRDCKQLSSIKAAPSTSVELKCPVGPGSGQQGTQNISWAKLKGGNPVFVNSTRDEFNDTSLTIDSVKASDSGWYRCMLGKTQSCFDIKLIVAEDATIKTTIVTVTGTKTQQALPTTETSLVNRKDESSGTFIATMTSVIIMIAIISALTGLVIYRRCHTQRTTMPQRQSAGTLMLSVDGYEVVSPSLSDDVFHQRNSLYQHFDVTMDESICRTFQP